MEGRRLRKCPVVGRLLHQMEVSCCHCCYLCKQAQAVAMQPCQAVAQVAGCSAA